MSRVTAAVVVNDRQVTEGAGQAAHAAWKPRTADEMRRLEGLARAAVGFDEKRGDEVVMENVGFSGNAPEIKVAGTAEVVEQARSLLGAQPGLLKTAMVGILGLLVIWLVLRPLAGQVVATLKEPALLGAGVASSTVSTTAVEETREMSAGAVSKALEAEPQPALTAPAAKPAPAPRMKLRASEGAAVYEQVAEHIKREPAQSTRLLEAWIGSAETSE